MKIRKSHPNKTRHFTQENGDRVWILNNGKFHRLDGPAVIKPDGTKEWWINGIPHREDGPAIERVDGYREWCINGKRHRIDGPAIVYPNGLREWFFEGKHHRLDGPAVEHKNGLAEWWINGQRFDPDVYFEIRKHPELINAMIVYSIHKS
jgi:hypothetical protein